jgi:hypothetical protein
MEMRMEAEDEDFKGSLYCSLGEEELSYGDEDGSRG